MSSGSFVRGIHVYGSSAIIIVLLLHIAQTILFGSYKGHRHLLWLSGCVLFALMLAMAFTGYLLPWDQKAYFATAVSTNIFVLPVIGPWFVATHVYLFRRAGAAGPPVPRRSAAESFYPRQLIMDIAFAAMLVLALGALAHWIPAELGPEANAADTHFLPRPEWYYVPIFQWLKYWPGDRAVVGIFVIPTIVAVLFAALPFIDRGTERRPWRRPWSVGACAALMIALVTLGVRSREQDRSDPAVASQLDAQRDAVRAFMAEPFEPQESAGSLRVANASLAAVANPLAARGQKVFGEQSCDVCHGPDGHGSDSGPSLVGAAARHTEGELSRIIKVPTQKMSDSGMQPLDIPDDDLAALTAYVSGLK